MNWLAIINEVFSVAWLVAVLVFLVLIWRSSERRLRHAEAMEKTIIDVAAKDAENARQAVETTRILASIIQNEQAK